MRDCGAYDGRLQVLDRALGDPEQPRARDMSFRTEPHHSLVQPRAATGPSAHVKFAVHANQNVAVSDVVAIIRGLSCVCARPITLYVAYAHNTKSFATVFE